MDIRPLSPHTVMTTRGNSKNQTALVKHNGKDEIQLDLSGELPQTKSNRRELSQGIVASHCW